MAKVRWSVGIDSVSGALAKPNKKSSQHSCETYLLGKHRVAATTSNDCNRLYMQKAYTYNRSTAISVNEMQARTRFAAVRQAVWDRAHDLNQISQDQAAFLAQKDLPNGKRTMNAYLWKVCGEAYDANH